MLWKITDFPALDSSDTTFFDGIRFFATRASWFIANCPRPQTMWPEKNGSEIVSDPNSPVPLRSIFNLVKADGQKWVFFADFGQNG